MANFLLRIVITIAIVFSVIGLVIVLIYVGSIFFIYPEKFGSGFSIIFSGLQFIIPTLNIIVLSITFGVIAYYSIEANRLRKITSKQLSYNMRPVIVLKLKKQSNLNDYLEPTIKQKKLGFPISNLVAEIKNVGKGIATNITLKPIVITNNKGEEVDVLSGEIMPLAEMDREEIGLYVPIQTDYIADKLLYGEVKDEIIKICYEDLQGIKYYTKMKMRERGGEWCFFKTDKEELKKIKVPKD